MHGLWKKKYCYFIFSQMNRKWLLFQTLVQSWMKSEFTFLSLMYIYVLHYLSLVTCCFSPIFNYIYCSSSPVCPKIHCVLHSTVNTEWKSKQWFIVSCWMIFHLVFWYSSASNLISEWEKRNKKQCWCLFHMFINFFPSFSYIVSHVTDTTVIRLLSKIWRT